MKGAMEACAAKFGSTVKTENADGRVTSYLVEAPEGKRWKAGAVTLRAEGAKDIPALIADMELGTEDDL